MNLLSISKGKMKIPSHTIPLSPERFKRIDYSAQIRKACVAGGYPES